MQEYLCPSEIIDFDNRIVCSFVEKATEKAHTPKDKVLALYLKVRDYILYDPYTDFKNQEVFKASYTIEQRRNFCIPKAIALVAGARYLGIPARLGFADVKNHLASDKLIELMKTNVFAFHGYAELFMNEKWVKATPTFNRHLCKMFRVRPLEFDGAEDSVFHEFSTDGEKHMEYLHDHGRFTEMPFDLMHKVMKEHYPHWYTDGIIDNVDELAKADEIYQ